MKVNVYKIRSLMIKVLRGKGLTNEEAKIVAEDYWNAELTDKKTHGVVKFLKEFQYFDNRRSRPKIVLDKNSLVLVDANKEIGQLAANYCVELLIKRTKMNGIALIGMKNSQRYGMLSSWALKIAKANLIGIVTNSCEPATVAYGGISPILGTNPLAIGIPTDNKPILLDMATSKAPMSALLVSQMYKTPLPAETFLDKTGKYTTDVQMVKSVEHFGGYKGYALSMVLEILSGSLLNARMGSKIMSFYDIGYYFQAIDPSVFQPVKDFNNQNQEFIKEIKESVKAPGVKNIKIPGEGSEILRKLALKRKIIDLPESLYKSLMELN